MTKKETGCKGPTCPTRGPVFPCLNGKRQFFIAINRAFLRAIADKDRTSTILFSRAILTLLYEDEGAS